MIKRIGHAAYIVKDMETSLRFYCGVLGFQKVFELPKPDGTPALIYLKVAEGQFIELFYDGVHPYAFNRDNVGYYHLCFEVDDIHKIADHLTAHGIDVFIGPKQGRDTNWQCWVKDPDGNRIEFMQLSPDSPQAKA
ncbi:VOC family protein [Paenibacillus hamazuiensis]|uniref:VOC family protein n=1 Tax=Paenibacillus hamazuiensis TaxID=2936508 RepID=UPI0020105FBF|nr:VOC family protein [Paenibacillus hamazuiensis]